MKPIQIIFIVFFFPTIWFVLNLRRNRFGKLFTRIGLLFLIITYFLALIFPMEINSLARILGVGRGADLLLYSTSASLLFFILVIVVKINQMEEKTSRIVREIAILQSITQSREN